MHGHLCRAASAASRAARMEPTHQEGARDELLCVRDDELAAAPWGRRPEAIAAEFSFVTFGVPLFTPHLCCSHPSAAPRHCVLKVLASYRSRTPPTYSWDTENWRDEAALRRVSTSASWMAADMAATW